MHQFIAFILLALTSVTGLAQSRRPVVYTRPLDTPIVNKNAEVYTYVDAMPEFKGDLKQYISQNLQYPAAAKQAGIEGRVIVTFRVEPDGSVSNIKVKDSLHYGCDEEAIRLVKSMPKWRPGVELGRPVGVYYNLPVVFKAK